MAVLVGVGVGVMEGVGVNIAEAVAGSTGTRVGSSAPQAVTKMANARSNPRPDNFPATESFSNLCADIWGKFYQTDQAPVTGKQEVFSNMPALGAPSD